MQTSTYRDTNKLSYMPQRNKDSILSSGGYSDIYDVNASSSHSNANMQDDISNRSAGDFFDHTYNNRMGFGGDYNDDNGPLISNPLDYEFNPKHFYWLFNPQLKFNKRHGFCVEDDLNPKDFMKMRELNRRSLTLFL